MSTANEKYQPRICRLCLSITATYYSLIDGGDAPKMLEAITSLKILPTDDISTVTCLKCVLNLKLAFILQQNILGAEQRFRQRIMHEVLSKSNVLEESTPQDVTVTIQDDADIKPELQPLVSEEMAVSTEEVTSQEVPVAIQEDLRSWVAMEARVFYQCDICGALLVSEDCLHTHRTSFHKIAAVTCEPEETQTVQSACSLRVAEMSEKLFVCAFCGVKAKSQLLIKRHINNFHKRKLCKECNKFVPNVSFVQHVKSHTPQENTKNDDSLSEEKDERFTDDSGRNVEKEKPFQDDRPCEEEPNISCFTCGEVNPSEEHIREHFPKKCKVRLISSDCSNAL